MLLTHAELDEIAVRCEGLQSIAHVYEEVRARRGSLDAAEVKGLFLWCIRELMQRGRLRFLGEGWVRDGLGTDAPLMFGDQPFGGDDVIINGLRQPTDPTPAGVADLIDSKWPTDPRPAFNANEPGFDPVWFEKWYFVWLDPATGKPIVF
jgi:hypothetical protein